MSQWFHDPLVRGRVLGAHLASATIIRLSSGEGALFADAPRQLVVWDRSLWEDWLDAFFDTPSQAEIIHQLVGSSGDILPSVLRAQAGTTALDMSDTTHEYRIQAVQSGFVVATDINTGTLSVTAGDLTIEDGHLDILNSAWNAGHIILGAYHIWVDATGDLRIKNGAPGSDLDGTVVGTQT
jgi:hypothetical protein